jgi:hypothetical protein
MPGNERKYAGLLLPIALLSNLCRNVQFGRLSDAFVMECSPEAGWRAKQSFRHPAHEPLISSNVIRDWSQTPKVQNETWQSDRSTRVRRVDSGYVSSGLLCVLVGVGSKNECLGKSSACQEQRYTLVNVHKAYSNLCD